jgi:hypothetical protein
MITILPVLTGGGQKIMKLCNWKNKLVFVIIGLFVGTSFFPAISGQTGIIEKTTDNATLRSIFDNEHNYSPMDIVSGLVGYWSFDDGTATDNSGSGNHGTKFGTIFISGGGPNGKGCLSFDGVDDYITVPHSSSLYFQNTFSISVFVKPTSDNMEFVTKAVFPNPWTGFCLRYYTSNKININVYNTGGTNANVNFNINIIDGNWHHIVGTYDGSTVKLYIDKNQVASGQLSGNVGNSEPLRIGYDTPEWSGAFFNGLLDETRIYNRTLTQDDINELYDITFNHDPAKPDQPSGETNGEVGNEYSYTTSTIDPDGDQVYYLWDWGDGNVSEWMGPYDSGLTSGLTHTWTVKGSYNIKVKAKDTHGIESPWSDPLSITMPYSFSKPTLPFWEMLFQRFPNAFPILRYLLGY